MQRELVSARQRAEKVQRDFEMYRASSISLKDALHPVYSHKAKLTEALRTLQVRAPHACNFTRDSCEWLVLMTIRAVASVLSQEQQSAAVATLADLSRLPGAQVLAEARSPGYYEHNDRMAAVDSKSSPLSQPHDAELAHREDEAISCDWQRPT